MILDDLYEFLLEEINFNLEGDLSFEGIAIKWEYDSFNKEFEIDENELEHLHRIYDNDLEILKPFLEKKHIISDPTIEDTYISFYIEE